MNSALYIGATGMKSLSSGLNVITNNLANVSTVGFKQQMVTYSDLIYQSQGNLGESFNTADDSQVAMGQVGMGVQIDAVRTVFNQGAFESSNTMTDMAIAGKGFFQVTGLDGETLYSRAGNFRPDVDGFLKLPSGETLNGYPIDDTGNKGSLGPVQIDKFDTMDGKGTTQVDLILNLGSISNNSTSTTDPFFGMVQGYDPTVANPSVNSSYSQPFQIYDATGAAQELSIHFDGTSNTSPENIMEFLVTDPETGNPLMTGTLTFSSNGEIIDMSAFSPTDPTNTQDLTTWTPSTLSNGLPQINYNGQSINLNLGISSQGGWENAPASAADVALDKSLLPSMGQATFASNATRAYDGSNSVLHNEQDGYGDGQITGFDITAEGRIVGSYTNGQTQDLFEIPVARFTSEDGLYREGGNLFSATPAAGAMELGVAGTENYGTIQAYSLEMSNVDMAREMVNMIVTQRGFQSNSKSVTTADEMLKKAMELKRQ